MPSRRRQSRGLDSEFETPLADGLARYVDAVFGEVAGDVLVGGARLALLPQTTFERAAQGTVSEGEYSGLSHQVYKILVELLGVKHPCENVLWTFAKKVGKLRAVAKKQPTLGQVLKAARKEAGDPAFDTIARRLEIDWGVMVTYQTVINYHDDAVAKPDLEIVQALVAYYGLTLADLPADIRERCERLRDRLVAASANHPSRTGRKGYAPRDSNPEPAEYGLGVSVSDDTFGAKDTAISQVEAA